MARSSLAALALLLAACVGDAPTTGPQDGGSDSPSSADSAATLSIPTIRNPTAAGHPSVGTFVKVEGVVVTGVKSTGTNHGFFIQDPNANAWGGDYVYTGPATVSVTPGAIVTVTGVVILYRGHEMIDVATGSYAQTGTASVPAPLDVVPSDIRAGSPTAMQYQSMLLRVKSVTAKTATNLTDFTVTSAAGNDDLYITSFVANDVGASPFPATAGQTYTSIVGRGYKFGSSDVTAVSKLAPASPAELVTP